MQQRAAGVVEVGEHGLAQQVVAEAEAPVGAAEAGRSRSAASTASGCGERGELGAVERRGPATAASSAARRAGSSSAAIAARTAPRSEAGGAVLAAPGGAGALEREQRVAVGGGDHALALRRVERATAPTSASSSRAVERLELELARPRRRGRAAACTSASTASRRGVMRRVSTSSTGSRSIRRAR